MNATFSISLRIFDADQLRRAALAHPDCGNETFLRDDGAVDVKDCLVMLLDPGHLPGCDIFESDAEVDDES